MLPSFLLLSGNILTKKKKVSFSSNLRLQSTTGKSRFKKEHELGTRPNVWNNGIEHKTKIQIHESTTTYIFTKTPEPEVHVREKLPSLANVQRALDILVKKNTTHALKL